MAAARLGLRKGARVSVLDEGETGALRERAEQLQKEGAHVRLGVRDVPKVQADLVVVSPGVLPQGPLGQLAASAETEVISELEFGWRFMQEIPVIGITGTNGKTTTTELCAAILNGTGIRCWGGGNIGYPVSQIALERERIVTNVFEISSFQLERVNLFRPRVGVLTNLTPDHLERYASMREYVLAKLNLFKKQTDEDWMVIQWGAVQMVKEDLKQYRSKLITYSAEHPEADLSVKDGWIVCSGKEGLPGGKWLEVKELKLLGNHNVENVMAALVATVLRGVGVEEAAQVAKEFKPSAHRCELVDEIEGVQYIDDSKATNVDAVRQALKMEPVGRKTWLIAGGKDKGFDFGGLEDLLSTRVREAILIGETREKIRNEWQGYAKCVLADSLEEAVSYASQNAARGEVVLLSPACSSFDMFRSYAHRGEVFRESVEKLKKGKTI